MNDLKLFALDEDSSECMMQVADEGSESNWNELGVRKCGVAHMTKCKRRIRGTLTVKGQ